ncbi:MAG TPA: hypothetical protein VHE34_18800 [Puia sp.]|uniref:hypothetical protein n=1 Tax=Puia sp. TaxID=2045100 RepID=UPI002C690C78|nr:hypothetical protein [Puia sp.]HVU97290.1 hypothetical protein [Puia sp.]
MISTSRRKFLQTTAFLAAGSLLNSRLVRAAANTRVSGKKSVECGTGKVDIKRLLQHARQAGMKHFFLEQEEYAHSGFESVRFDYNYLAQLDY